MKIKIPFLIFTILLFGLLLNSCNKNNDVEPENKYLVNASLVIELTTAELKALIQANLGSNAAQANLFIRSGIKQIKITYNTKDLEGNAIVASGALIIPKDLSAEPLALASIQHGTLFNEADAPSYFANTAEATLGTFIASTGFFIALPDYIGYGESKNLNHPYEHKKGIAEPGIDFIRSVIEYIKEEKLNWNTKLLLGGYSQGGYSTMCIQKEIEEKHSNEFNLVASSCGSGAYNKTATIKDFLLNKTSGETTNNRSYIWVMLTYDKIYKFNRPMSDYFIEPFASQIAKDGFRVTINKSFDEILNPNFKKGILDGTETKWINALAENDVFNWKPTVPTRLYHGDADTYVPFLNSSTAEAAMKKNGSSSVELITIKGGTHSTAIFDFFLGTFELFSKYKK